MEKTAVNMWLYIKSKMLTDWGRPISYWMSMYSCLFPGLRKLQDQNTFCDVTLRVGSRSFQAHKAVLSSCSDYFMAMFTSGFQEAGKTSQLLSAQLWLKFRIYYRTRTPRSSFWQNVPWFKFSVGTWSQIFFEINKHFIIKDVFIASPNRCVIFWIIPLKLNWD